MHYIQKVNIIIYINWVQIEYAEGESTCLAQKYHVVRPQTNSNPLPHNQLLITSYIAIQRENIHHSTNNEKYALQIILVKEKHSKKKT
jgi:hypothetical protein